MLTSKLIKLFEEDRSEVVSQLFWIAYDELVNDPAVMRTYVLVENENKYLNQRIYARMATIVNNLIVTEIENRKKLK